MAQTRENGVNMLDVKINNRGAILQLIHECGSISRKDIAQKLGLTPAAITVITGELMDEGLVVQADEAASSPKKGRREVLLRINSEDYVAIGVYITRHKLRVLCMNFKYETIFEELIYTADCHKKAGAVLEKLENIIRQRAIEYDILRTKTIVGLGVSIKGIVDSVKGVSINSYQVWEEKNVPVAEILEQALGFPVLLTNNICSLTHGEHVIDRQRATEAMLLIKYGPGLGACHTVDASAGVAAYQAIQLGHMISEPHGSPCVCGNNGCLETIIHYDAIENIAKGVLSEQRTPVLWEMTGGDPNRANIAAIVRAYDEGEAVIGQLMDRVVFYLSLGIKNSLTLFAPESIVLYGELFENKRFRAALETRLASYANTDCIRFSRFNMSLGTFGPAATIVSLFFENGGIIEN